MSSAYTALNVTTTKKCYNEKYHGNIETILMVYFSLSNGLN